MVDDWGVGDTQQFVDHRAVFGEPRGDLADQLDLLIAEQARTLDEHDAGMDLPRTGELGKVIDIRRHEYAVFLIGALEDIVIARSENPAIANVASIDPVGGQRNRCRRGQVLIEE